MHPKTTTRHSLNNTYTSANPPPDNWAHGYMPGPDNELTDVGHPEISDGTVMQGANAVKTSAADLLKYYTAVLEAWRLEADAATGPIELSNPLRCVKDLLSGPIPLDPEAPFDQWYGMGWALADLPAPLGSIGTNGMFLPSMPIVGKGGKKTRVWYHNGSLVGFFSSVHIVPETGTIIVVLTNSITKHDGADWLGQLVLEQLLDNSDKNDYTALAKETAAAYDGMWVQLQHDCNVSVSDSESASELPSRPLSQYTGRYYNKPGNWHIEVKESSDGANLEFAFQSRQTQTHTLQHYKGSTFSWFLTELQSRRLARWPDLDKPTYLFNFVEDRTGDGIGKLVWEHDPDVPGGETFVKAKGEPANKKKDEKGENKGEGSALGHQIEEL